MRNYWKDISVVKKLYAVVGLMAILIATELFTLLFAMNTLSSVRAFVMGEGLWTKAQKDALHSLSQYARYGKESYFVDFNRYLRVPDGDHKARIEMQKPHFDWKTVRAGFIEGDNHPDDVDGMIKLLSEFHNVSYIADAIKAWTKADTLLAELRTIADRVHQIILTKGKNAPEITQALQEISRINSQLTEQEVAFSASLGAGSRFLELLLMTVLALTVLTIESTGIFLTYRFSRNLSDSLNELIATTERVGRGNFSQLATVRSKDELGQLALSVNKMIGDLKSSTQRREVSEEVLRRSEEKFRLLVEAVKDYAIHMLDRDGHVTTWNSGAENITGYTSNEVIGKHFSLFFTPEDLAADMPSRELEVARTVGRYESDCRRLRKDGTTFWANVIISALYSQDGQITGFSKVVRDITERKNAQEQLRALNLDLERRVVERTQEMHARETQLRLITDSLPILIAQLDSDECILFANKSFCDLLKRSFSEIKGQSFKSLLGEERYSANAQYLKKVLKGETTTYERVVEINGRMETIQITLVPEMDTTGKVLRFVLVASNVTQFKEIEDQLKSAKFHADSANAAKSAFLANMSHEIRTPLGAILGFSELILNPEMSTADRIESVDVIKRNGELLSNIINDILDLSKVEAGKLEIEKVDVSLDEVMSEIKSLLSLRASDKGIKLVVTSEGTLPQTIRTDPLRLRQILLNVVGNAVKFTQQGMVEVKIRLVPGKDNRSTLAFVVIDTGVGISPDQLDKLFTPFSQADASTTRQYGGTGLGLVLSKKLANSLGGDVRLLESAPGKGSTFEITLDPGHVERVLFDNFTPHLSAKNSKVDDAVRLDKLKILLVDDCLDNQVLVCHYLRRAGATVDTASNGREGVGKALKDDYELVLMDIQMPIMDGYEAMRELKNKKYEKPVIALTAHAMTEERRRCLDFGFADHVSKPINRQLLLQIISRFSA